MIKKTVTLAVFWSFLAWVSLCKLASYGWIVSYRWI